MEQLEQEEQSYNNFIESMEAEWMSQYSIGSLVKGIDLTTGNIEDMVSFNEALQKNKDVLMATPVQAVIVRGATETAPQNFYRKLIQTGTAFIKEVEQLK